MNVIFILFFILKINYHFIQTDDSLITYEVEAEKYLSLVNGQLGEQLRNYSLAQWSYATNITDETSEAQVLYYFKKLIFILYYKIIIDLIISNNK